MADMSDLLQLRQFFARMPERCQSAKPAAPGAAAAAPAVAQTSTSLCFGCCCHSYCGSGCASEPGYDCPCGVFASYCGSGWASEPLKPFAPCELWLPWLPYSAARPGRSTVQALGPPPGSPV